MSDLAVMLVNKYIEREIIKSDDKTIYQTGLELIFADIINFALIIIAGLITNSLIYSGIYLVMLWSVRRFSGGFHAKTYGVCRIVTVGTYIVLLYICNRITIYENVFTIVMNVLSIVTMILFAPIKHPNKTLTDAEKHANKFFAVVISTFFSIISLILILCNRKEGVIISLSLLAISILMYIGILINKLREVKENEKVYR